MGSSSLMEVAARMRGLMLESMAARAERDQVLGLVGASFTPRHDVMSLQKERRAAPAAAMAVAREDGRPDGRRDGGVGPAAFVDDPGANSL